ncbi:putative PurR-regulated permease PerM [Azospirillum lipoferum]|uniref:AI-2E family transporter n=1 Tax=Azospirillum lipoferum TaxID=193 RepID=A0A5A9GU01_AZOLI|nr:MULTISPECIES: AI-2E family transporter [Azospirillum]KAA0597272.1 AI-2E family transporter [Azospirillum lipoferum]MCP1608792.1 putative PurR-regulated permease PerM [Azospirillum lipoferum]MDW5535893.1 AI-2E family transporter [Azospirillum sp. NL1]
MATPSRPTAYHAATHAPTPGGGAAQTAPPARAGRGELAVFTWKVLIVAGVAALSVFLWRISGTLLLIFTGVLFAILLQRLTGYVQRGTRLGHGWSLAIVLLVLVLLVGGGVWLMGTSMAAQLGQLQEQVTKAMGMLPDGWRDRIMEQGKEWPWMNQLSSFASGLVYVVGDAVVVMFAALYLAASPGVYQRGVVLLVPPRGQKRACEVMEVAGDSLWKWLIGQLVAMAAVGTMIAVGLWLIGIPSALALGIVAGLLEFIPLVGPFLAAVPAILIGFAQSPQDALWVAGLYLVIQQVEGNLITPLLQKRVVDLPPVVTIGAIAAGGVLFGIMGMFLATPLAVVVLVLVNLLYIEDKLGEPRHFPSDHS